jgi:hypothetical protein
VIECVLYIHSLGTIDSATSDASKHGTEAFGWQLCRSLETPSEGMYIRMRVYVYEYVYEGEGWRESADACSVIRRTHVLNIVLV